MSGDPSIKPIVESWEHYRAARIGTHAGDSELRARGEAYLCGARAAFDALCARLNDAEEFDDVSRVLEEIAAELGMDELASS
jgi:hypothetical protein